VTARELLKLALVIAVCALTGSAIALGVGAAALMIAVYG
jgi:hypothetical protein